MKPEKIYTHEEMLDKVLGKPGDLARQQYETDINAFLIGETIKKARLQPYASTIRRADGC